MRFAVVVTAVLCLARTAYSALTVTVAVAPYPADATKAYTGSTVSYSVSVQDRIDEKGLVLHVPTPPGMTLLRVADTGTNTVDCTKASGGPLGFAWNVECNVGGEMRASSPDGSGTPRLILTYQAPATAGTVTYRANLTCDVCTPQPMSSTSTTILAPMVSVLKTTSDATQVVGSNITWYVNVKNTGELRLDKFTVDDTMPPGVTLVRAAGVEASVLSGTPKPTSNPDSSAQISYSGGKLQLTGPALDPQSSYQFPILARIEPTVEQTVITNVAVATPLNGNPVSSEPARTQISSTPLPLTLTKRVTPDHGAIGESVTYTLTVRPTGRQDGPITLVDPIDPQLKLTAVKVNGQPAACGAASVSAGPGMLDCGADGRTVTFALPDGLAAPVALDLTATILPLATSSIANIASLTDRDSNKRTAEADLAVTNASKTGAALLLTSAKLQAEKDELVPFVAQIGVATSSATLGSAILTLTPSRGLRVADVRVTAPDGSTMPVRPVETGAKLIVPVGTLPPGSTASVLVRARVSGRATVGERETLAAALTQDDRPLAGASAGVRITADPEFDLGTVLGEVYRDDNGNGRRDRGEPGLGGALVVMDDGLQVVTDNAGRYHLSAVIPGDRAIKVAGYTLPPGSTLTTDGTRIIPVTPGALVKVDFGVQVPAPEPPRRKPAASTMLPELHPAEGGKLGYRLTGVTATGARVTIGGHPARVDKLGIWAAEVELVHGRNRFTIVDELPDGRVVVGVRDVYWVDRVEGGGMVVPREEEARLTLRFPAGALAEPTFLLEGMVHSQLRSLSVAGQSLVPDPKGKVELKLRVPESGAGIAIDAQFADGTGVRFDHLLNASGNFVLLVGLAEGKIGYVQKSDASGSSSGFFAKGRVKMYAKGRIQGRWLLEGGLDIDTSQLDSWRDLFRGDPQRIFRNLDPDRFYTVYGDASQTTAAAQSRARLFVRIAIDRSELLFGNVQTGLTGVEMGRYSRAVTGGRIEVVRAGTDAANPNAPPSTQVILFGAWLHTARAHDELRGSGGSLYYLSHRTVVEGSEQVRIEIRDKISDRPLANTPQRASIDYEIDYLAGRVIMREPLSSVAASPTLVRSGNIDGDRAFLVVDYEYLVEGDSDDSTLGARATQRLGPVRLGGTVVNEFRSVGNYTLLGGDLQIDLKKYGVIIGEYAHSYGALTSFARSDDGGLSFTDALGTTQSQPAQREGSAYKAEADLHFGAVALHPYFRGIDQGYTDTAHAQDAGFMQWGADASAKYWGVTLRLHYDERRYQQALVYDAAGNPVNLSNQTRRDVGGEVGRSFGRVGIRVGARSERADDADWTRAGHRTAIAARVDVRIVPKLSLYGAGQYAVEKGGGNPTYSLVARDNSLGALGAIVQLPWQTKATGEVSYGAQGAGGLVSLRSEIGPGRVIYGTATLSQDRDDRVSAAVAAGGRERINDAKGNARATLYAEDQFRDGPFLGAGTGGNGGRAHMQTAGLDIPLAKRFVLGASFERGEVTPSGTPMAGAAPLDRTAGSLYASYGGERLRAQVKAELRQDSLTKLDDKKVDELQWLVQAMVTWRVHPDVTLRGKLFMSQSTGLQTSPLLRSNEATAGFAWRPSWTDRFALLGRYTWLDEGLPPAQAASGPTDPLTGATLGFRERAHVVSLAGDGRAFWRISIGGKIAAKLRQESQPDGVTSAWMTLWINRITLHITRTWDALAEYRLLYGPGPAITHGVAVEVNRIIVGHLRLGVGWNFSDVGDDETALGRGSEKGFFVRAQGFY